MRTIPPIARFFIIRRPDVLALVALAGLVSRQRLIAKTVTLTQADNRTAICLIEGDTLIVTLPSPIHSYHWKLLSEASSPLSETREFAATESKNANPTETFHFNAASTGKTKLVLGFRTSDLDSAQQTTETYSVDVTVASGAPNVGLLIGTYKGTTACADCTGIQTELRLYAPGKNDFTDTTYISTRTYLGGRNGDRSSTERGQWGLMKGDAVDPNATVYALNPDRPEHTQYFLVQPGGTVLTEIDKEMKPLTAPPIYILTLKRTD